MNIGERTEFWKKLCSLSANYIENDSKALQTLIKYPRYLYRYRTVTEQSIEALAKNTLYFSRSDYYDDPFDTLVKIDFDIVAEKIKEVFVGNEFQIACDTIKECYGENSKEYYFIKSLFNNVNQEKAISLIKEYLKLEIRPLLQKQTWSTCFSETGWNETMWLKYADRYYGFCLVYDLEDEKRRICGKKEKCEKCVVNKAGISLYPMYYSDDGYDATEYVSYLAVAHLAQSNFSPEITSGIVEKLPPMFWQREKISLVKAKCHEKDEEWRMILNINADKGKLYQKWVPCGVILGLRTTAEHRDIIIRAANIAGINNIFESYIDDRNKLAIRNLV